MLLIIVLFGLFVVLTPLSGVSTSTVYVNSTGNDITGNGSAENPYQTIGKGISSVEENGILQIADGKYSGTGNTNLKISKNVNIMGQHPEKTIIDGKSSNWIFQINPRVKVTITNLTFTNATTTGNGGAIYNMGTIYRLSGCTFTDNTADAGGAIFNRGNMGSVSGCTFTNNYATTGGAIYNNGTTSVSGCTFTNNNASIGGAIYNDGTICSVGGCTFTGNNVSKHIQIAYGGSGGAIFNRGNVGSVSGCTFTGNVGSYMGGGAIFSGAADVHVTMGSVSSCTFTSNIADEGGAIENIGSSIIGSVNDCTFTSNIASDGGGGAVCNYGTSIMYSVSGCTFTSNIASVGGAIYNYDTMYSVSGCTFTDNTANAGGAIYNRGNHIDAKYNWWGSNNNPSSQINGYVDTSPWLCMTVSVDPSSIAYNGSSNVTVSFNSTNDGTSIPNGFHIPDGIIVSFKSDLGTFNAAKVITINGMAVVTFTGTSLGTGPITATTGNQRVSTDITVNKVSTTLIVDNVTVVRGKNAKLTATLKDKNGNPLKGKTVTFAVSGTNYTATTNGNGIATVNYKLTKAGVFRVNVSFIDGTVYASSSGNGFLTVKSAAKLYKH